MHVRIVALLLAGLLAACSRGPAPAPQATAPAAKPKPASAAVQPPQVERPSLRVTTLDGAEYDLAGQRGKWVIVNYWATWCGPCIKEMPELSALAAMRQHIAVIGLAFEDTSEDELRAFLAKRPVAYPIARIDVYEPPKDFGAPRGLPTTWLIAPDGTLHRYWYGGFDAAQLEQIMREAGYPKRP